MTERRLCKILSSAVKEPCDNVNLVCIARGMCCVLRTQLWQVHVTKGEKKAMYENVKVAKKQSMALWISSWETNGRNCGNEINFVLGRNKS